ncbi:MAG: SusC/RagA family TonB-linked outer membrane protein, partial [Balneolaceae bacterium]|nr:SusC/RagA family TonB-linked outer membrane protein [Balneolaceae bacterium]
MMQHRLPYTIAIIVIMLCAQAVLSTALKAQNSVEEGSKLMSSIYIESLQERDEMIPLPELLKTVENSFHVTFLYEQNLLAHKHVPRSIVDLTNDTGRELSEVLDELGFTYHQIDQETYVILAKKTNLKPVILQQSVSGTVTDQETGETIPGVNISVPGTAIGTTTDMDGQYELDNIPDDVTELVYSFVGYQSQTVPINGRSVIDVQLEQEVAMLDDVVVIGYGERQRGDITGSISSVTSEKLEQSTSVSPELALQGRTPGVQISNVSGNPLARPEIRIRGISTFGVADPLIVIDGVPITEFGSGAEGSSAANRDLRGDVNILSMINPGDIESISVLKDASAAAIYGVRGANGVILINTKGGQRSSPQIRISAQRGIQNVPQLDVLNVQQYTELYQESYANNPDQAGNLPTVFEPSSANYLGNMSFVDWQDEFVNHDAISEDYSARVSGGTDDLQYYISGGYSNTESTIVGNQLQRYSFAGNLNATVSDRVRVGATYRLAYADALDNTGGANISNAYLAPPWQPLYDTDGSYYDMNTYATSQGFAPSTNFSGERIWGPQSRGNPLGRRDLNFNGYEVVRNIGSAFIEVEPLNNLSFRATLNGDWYRNLNRQFTDIDDHWFSVTANGSDPGLAEGSIGSYRERDSINRNLTGELRTNY